MNKPLEQSGANGEVKSSCTSICNGRKGGMSCTKIVLVDVFLQGREEETQRIYATVDDQSNASMITTELADRIGAQGPREKYFLSTCSGDRVVKYGRRIPVLVVRPRTGKMSKLRMLIV